MAPGRPGARGGAMIADAAPLAIVLGLLGVYAFAAGFPLVLGNVRNALALLVLAATMNGLSVTVGPAGLRIEAFALAAVGVAVLLDAVHRREGVLGRVGPVALGALGAWWTLSLLSSVFVALEPVRSLFMLLNLTVGVLAFLAVAVYPSLHGDLVRWGTVVLAVVSGVSLLWLFLGPPGSILVADPQGGELSRVRGLSLEPNLMGGLCAAWLGVMYYWREQLSPALRSAAVPIGLALVFTNTRAAWVAFAVVFAFWLLTRQARFARSPHVIPLYLLGAVLLVSRAAGVDTVEGSLLWKLQNVFDFSTGNGLYRIESWRIALADLRTLRDHLFGLGVNSYSQHHPLDLTRVTEGYLGNVWLGWYYDSGLLGLVAFLVFLVVTVLRNPDWVDSVPAHLAVAIGATSTNSFWMVFPWIAIALVSAPHPRREEPALEDLDRRARTPAPLEVS